MIKPLTSLRFFAALWVFIFHLKIHGIVQHWGVFDSLVDKGPVGMTFFFILSGFILTMNDTDFTRVGAPTRFYVRRFARIYPLYIFIIVVSWPLIGFASDLGRHKFVSGLGHLAADLTLTTAWFPKLFEAGLIREGTWSLSVEAFFYLLFPPIYVLLRGLSPGRLVWVACLAIAITAYFSMIALVIGAQKDSMALYYSMPIFRLGEFVAGISAGIFFNKTGSSPSSNVTSAAIVAVTCYLFVVPAAIPYVAHTAFAGPVLILLFMHCCGKTPLSSQVFYPPSPLCSLVNQASRSTLFNA